ncbi:MAG: ABC transporter permease [Actinomycetota bacterium]|nr:ABC transporter permease [Actinomycetota bacterium]
MSTMTAGGAAAPSAGQEERSVSSIFRGYVEKIRGGDVGALPAVLGLVVLCIVFAALRPVFLSEGNFANLLVQGAGVAVIAMGLVFVLLLGEIDLSAGYMAGVAAAVLATMLAGGWSWPAATAAALVTGAVTGLLLGTLIARLGIPSFVVTLAAFLAFQGILLIIIGQGGTIPIRNDVIVAIANSNVPPLLGWILWGVGMAAFAAVTFLGAARRRQKGLPNDPLPVLLARIGLLALVTGFVVLVLNQNRARNPNFATLAGVPVVVPIVVVLLILLSFVLRRTAYGRHVYAVGGNAEAARRAGINVAMIRTSVFIIGSTLAAIGGIILASRLNSVSPGTGGSNTLLYAVGAAVIGGTSLFGGKGRVVDAILGGAVIAVIDNGMGLLGASSGVKFVVTGLVLLVAASVDALSRRRAAAAGRG